VAFKTGTVMAYFIIHPSSTVRITFIVFNAVNVIVNKQFSLKGGTFCIIIIDSLNPKLALP
jgi:hypothetical protein